MLEGVVVTVAWALKPELVEACIESLRGMFPQTRLRPGFRNIRLLRSDIDPSQFLLIEEWDEAQNFHDYVQFRTDTGDMERLLAMTVSPPQIGIWSLNPVAAADR